MEKKEVKMIQANMSSDPEYQIRMLDFNAVHVLQTRISVDPRNPLYPSKFSVVKCYPLETWNNLEDLADPKKHRNPISWKAASGWIEAKVLSHPDKWNPEQRAEYQAYYDSIINPVKPPVDNLEEVVRKQASEIRKLKRLSR